LERGVQRFLGDLSNITGLPFSPQPVDAAKAKLVIHTDHASKAIQDPTEDESYTIEVTASGAKISAPTPLGTLHGLQTFLQLVELTPGGFAAPVITIQDTPRFVWRGLLIDSSRHFIPLDVIRRNLDGMAAVKMNVLHWHLSDYQGFRVESKIFPKLQSMGSGGLYYTQNEIRDLIAYARDRGIRIVPEFDMPGHASSWFPGYPELASGPGPYQFDRGMGGDYPIIDPTRETTYRFLDKFIAEMAKLFPDPYFHIGGDEVSGKQWDANPKIQEFMKSRGIKNNQDLQAYFNQRVQKIVSKQGKKMIGWDEILHPDLPKSIVIHSWRGPESLAAAARQGYSGLLSNGYYIDLMWPAYQHYVVDPMSGSAATLTPEEKQRILGGEATMWSEYVSPENIDSRIWPRSAAIAERFWSPQSVNDVNSMYQRLGEVSRRLDLLGLTHNSSYTPMLQRIAGTQDIPALRLLADVVEPVKDYNREDLAAVHPTCEDPLNRLVDAARPESEMARLFAKQIDSFIAGQCKATAELRSTLTSWCDNHARLEPLISQSFLLKEVEPLSQNLSAVGAVGLQAMDYIARGERPSNEWKTQQLALVEAAKKPTSAQLLLMVAAPVQKLIEASAEGGACQPAK
jgi:hexosaminidase